MENEKGRFIVVDGLDGIGKGVIESALVGQIEGEVFDSVQWCKDNPTKRPNVSMLEGYSGVLTGEPTYSGLGADIRNTLISNSNRGLFPASLLIRAYSLDREIQMRNFIVPAIRKGYKIIQSRSLATTLCYQTLNAEDEGLDPVKTREKILANPGNQYQLANAPDLLIIPTIGDIEELIRRLEKRTKKDDAIFENKEFLKRAKIPYESDWLRKIFEDHGTQVTYLDAGISVEESRRQAIEIWKKFIS
jgi:thymidylate kinase